MDNRKSGRTVPTEVTTRAPGKSGAQVLTRLKSRAAASIANDRIGHSGGRTETTRVASASPYAGAKASWENPCGRKVSENRSEFAFVWAPRSRERDARFRG